MVEKVFEYNTMSGRDKPTIGPCECGSEIGRWMWARSDAGKEYRVTVRVEPLPERVKWPWPDVSRVRVGPRCIDGHRNTLILTDAGWSLAWAIEKDLFGTWPANESRIASNDNGFVKLSEVANGKN